MKTLRSVLRIIALLGIGVMACWQVVTWPTVTIVDRIAWLILGLIGAVTVARRLF